MKHQWSAGAWAFLGAPAAIILGGYVEEALFKGVLKSSAFLVFAICLPGVCIGSGLLALLSLVRSAWPRAILASVYGVAMYVLAETLGTRVLSTHAVVISLSQ
jgi:hypothetical protein